QHRHHARDPQNRRGHRSAPLRNAQQSEFRDRNDLRQPIDNTRHLTSSSTHRPRATASPAMPAQFPSPPQAPPQSRPPPPGPAREKQTTAASPPSDPPAI